MTTGMDGERELASQLVARSQSDPAFKEKLTQDTVGTLLAEGLSPEAVGFLLREGGIDEAEVAGYMQGIGVAPANPAPPTDLRKINCGGSVWIPISACTLSAFCTPAQK